MKLLPRLQIRGKIAISRVSMSNGRHPQKNNFVKLKISSGCTVRKLYWQVFVRISRSAD